MAEDIEDIGTVSMTRTTKTLASPSGEWVSPLVSGSSLLKLARGPSIQAMDGFLRWRLGGHWSLLLQHHSTSWDHLLPPIMYNTDLQINLLECAIPPALQQKQMLKTILGESFWISW